MAKARSALVHLALGLAGWGIATLLSPLVPVGKKDHAEESATLPSKTPRPRLDVPGGRQILARLMTRRDSGEALQRPEWETASLDARIEEEFEDRDVHETATLKRITDPEKAYLAKADILVSRDLDSLINGKNGPDLAYAFRHGRMDALEIRDLLAARLPDHATHPAFLRTIYRELVDHDPLRAEVLLEDVPQPKAIQMKYDALDHIAEDFGPEQYFRFLASIPYSEDPTESRQRRRLHRKKAVIYLSLYESDFTRFVEQQAPGPDRDFNLEIIAKAHETSSPAEAVRVRRLTKVLQGLDGD